MKEDKVLDQDKKENEPQVVEKETTPAAQEEKKEDNSSSLIEVKPLGADDNLVELIESRRTVLLNSFKKARLQSRIVTGVVVLLIIGAIIFISFEGVGFKVAGYTIAGVVLLGMIVYYIFTKNKFPQASRQYIAEITGFMNSYVFSDSRFSEVYADPNKKLTAMDFAVEKAYKQPDDVGSRNTVCGKFDGKKFEVSDAALYQIVGGRKGQRKVVFLGKYVSFENNLDFEGRYIVNLKGNNPEKLVDQPTDIEDLKLEYDEGNIQIYGPEGKAHKTVFGTEFVKKLKDIRIDAPLLNIVAVIWSKHTGIYISYDDPVTTLPFEHEFTIDAQQGYRRDLLQLLDLFGQY